MTAYTTQTLAEVLKPRTCDVQLRCVQPMPIVTGTVQDKLVASAAEKVRSIYSASLRRVSYDEREPELFFDQCFDTYTVAVEVEQVAEDDTVASIAMSIFQRAGWYFDLLRPTTLAGQVQMQIAALDAARQAKHFFAKQAALI